MEFAVRYYTRGGNTKMVAEAIAYALEVDCEDIQTPLQKADVLFLGASMYAFTVDKNIKKFVSSLTHEQVKTIVVFSTSASDTSTHKKIAKCLKDKEIKVYEKHLSIPGQFLKMNKGRPNEQDLEKAKKFAKELKKELDK